MPLTLISKHYHTREEREQFASHGKDEHRARRLRGIALAMSALSSTEVARLPGVGAQTRRDWIVACNEDGAEGLRPRPRGCVGDGAWACRGRTRGGGGIAVPVAAV